MLHDIEALAIEAGAEILKIYNTDFDVDIKADESPLTQADLASHRAIVAGLKALTPDIPVLSEESAAIPFATRQSWTRYWLVDPLDGTKEFVKRNGEFTVNIALIDNGEPVLGVVHVPVTGKTYSGQQGEGASVIDASGSRSAISARKPAARPLAVVGSRSHAGEKLQAYIAALGDHEMVPMGSSLKICLVAEGKADLYPRLGLTSEWDTAAAHAVVLAAGGSLTDTAMAPLRYNTKDSYLNPEFFVFGDDSIDWSSYL
ncbi:MAG: 3'(2'),5'-bisphosphate nucleotidase CysQ [Lysobacteraceae bacterium]|nr:MAG: 3'(2'),5'-bisphosphate nucleotidase CysQ [Xanthomonadaceae bacterium]